MTQKEKDLLLKDLCARLPYRVIVHIKLNHNIHDLEYNSILHGFMLSENLGISQLDGYTKFINLNEDEVKPYLRPMSSMTENEKKTYMEISSHLCGEIAAKTMMDWLNARYFDYRDLIGKGLALEATEGMYKTE